MKKIILCLLFTSLLNAGKKESTPKDPNLRIFFPKYFTEDFDQFLINNGDETTGIASEPEINTFESKPEMTEVEMHGSESISAPTSSQKTKSIFTNGLCGCTAVACYVKTKDGKRTVVLTHATPMMPKDCLPSLTAKAFPEDPEEIATIKVLVAFPDGNKYDAEKIIEYIRYYVIRKQWNLAKTKLIPYNMNRSHTSHSHINDVQIDLTPDGSTFLMGKIGHYKKIDLDE